MRDLLSDPQEITDTLGRLDAALLLNPGRHINSPGAALGNGLGEIFRSQPAGEKPWNGETEALKNRPIKREGVPARKAVFWRRRLNEESVCDLCIILHARKVIRRCNMKCFEDRHSEPRLDLQDPARCFVPGELERVERNGVEKRIDLIIARVDEESDIANLPACVRCVCHKPGGLLKRNIARAWRIENKARPLRTVLGSGMDGLKRGETADFAFYIHRASFGSIVWEYSEVYSALRVCFACVIV